VDDAEAQQYKTEVKAHNAAHTGCEELFATMDVYPERVLQQRKLA